MEREPPLTKKQRTEADQCGGIDEEDYRNKEKPYYDKPDHIERSRHDDEGQHEKHWKKERPMPELP